MRVMSVLCVVIAGVIGLYSVGAGKDLSQAATLVGVFLAPAFGGKVVQKFAEKKERKYD